MSSSHACNQIVGEFAGKRSRSAHPGNRQGLKPAIEPRARMVALPIGPAQSAPDTFQYSIVISITYGDQNLVLHLQSLCLEALQPTLVAA